MHRLSLEEDKITVWIYFICSEQNLIMKQFKQNLLYHYISKLKAHWTELEDNSHHNVKFKHLNLLVKYMCTVYILTMSHLASLLKNHKIMYDLLWALFKLNTSVYTTILNAEKPTCYRYNFNKKRTSSAEITYFHVKCHYLDFNGKAFGEVSTTLKIWTFQGAKPIDRLEAFPLTFHQCHKEMREHFVRCGWQFVFLIGQHYVQYHDNAFYIEKNNYIKVSVNSCIMVDVAYFCKANSNYSRLHINDLVRLNSSDCFFIFSDTEVKVVKSSDLDTKAMSDNNLIICSQMMYGWSFDNKQWCKSLSLKYPMKWRSS
jgi:hypothetical protein